jgi:hypothetical protein
VTPTAMVPCTVNHSPLNILISVTSRTSPNTARVRAAELLVQATPQTSAARPHVEGDPFPTITVYAICVT